MMPADMPDLLPLKYLALVVEGTLMITFNAMAARHLRQWIDRRGWRPPDQQLKP